MRFATTIQAVLLAGALTQAGCCFICNDVLGCAPPAPPAPPQIPNLGGQQIHEGDWQISRTGVVGPVAYCSVFVDPLTNVTSEYFLVKFGQDFPFPPGPTYHFEGLSTVPLHIVDLCAKGTAPGTSLIVMAGGVPHPPRLIKHVVTAHAVECGDPGLP